MAPRPRPAAGQQDKPSKVHFNLDTYENPETVEPFVVVVGGRRYVLIDALDTDYRDLLAAQRAYWAGEPQKALDFIVAPDDREAFFANRLTNRKLTAMFEAYNSHYGIETDPGKASDSSSS